MGIKIPDFPYGLDTNECYKHLLADTTTTMNFEWSRRQLVEMFDIHAVNRIIHTDVVREVRGDQDLKLTFSISGTDANLVLKAVYDEVLVFSELVKHKSFPKSTKMDNMKLKGLVSYLQNFNMVTTGNLPGSGLTWVAADREVLDPDLDWIFQLSDQM